MCLWNSTVPQNSWNSLRIPLTYGVVEWSSNLKPRWRTKYTPRLVFSVVWTILFYLLLPLQNITGCCEHASVISSYTYVRQLTSPHPTPHHNKAIILIACVELTFLSPSKPISSDPSAYSVRTQAFCRKINPVTLHHQSRHFFSSFMLYF